MSALPYTKRSMLPYLLAVACSLTSLAVPGWAQAVQTPESAGSEPGDSRDISSPTRPTKLALVFGNTYRGASASDQYQSVPAAARDAQGMAMLLRERGFELVGDGPHIDVDRAKVQDLLELLVQRARQQRTSAISIFFSGHGTQDAGHAYLVPSNGTGDVRTLIPLRVVYDALTEAGSEINYLFLDACRQGGDFGAPGVTAADDVPSNTFIGFSADFGGIAVSAMDAGESSAYTKELLAALRAPGDSDIDQVLLKVSASVVTRTSFEQHPVFAVGKVMPMRPWITPFLDQRAPSPVKVEPLIEQGRAVLDFTKYCGPQLLPGDVNGFAVPGPSPRFSAQCEEARLNLLRLAESSDLATSTTMRSIARGFNTDDAIALLLPLAEAGDALANFVLSSVMMQRAAESARIRLREMGLGAMVRNNTFIDLQVFDRAAPGEARIEVRKLVSEGKARLLRAADLGYGRALMTVGLLSLPLPNATSKYPLDFEISEKVAVNALARAEALEIGEGSLLLALYFGTPPGIDGPRARKHAYAAIQALPDTQTLYRPLQTAALFLCGMNLMLGGTWGPSDLATAAAFFDRLIQMTSDASASPHERRFRGMSAKQLFELLIDKGPRQPTRSLPTNSRLAMEYLKIAAKSGEPGAAQRLAKIYRDGDHGIARDLQEAQKWLEQSNLLVPSPGQK